MPSPVVKKNRKGRYANDIDDISPVLSSVVLIMLTLPLVDFGGSVDRSCEREINEVSFCERAIGRCAVMQHKMKTTLTRTGIDDDDMFCYSDCCYWRNVVFLN